MGEAKIPEAFLEPTTLDILHGKDRVSLHHIGNKSFRALMACIVQQYPNLSSKSQKSRFLKSIVQSIEGSGGRFLSEQDDRRGWRQDSLKKARQKVRHTLSAIITRKGLDFLKQEDMVAFLSPFYKSPDNFDWKGIVGRVKDQAATQEGVKSKIMLEVIHDPTDLDVLHGRDDFSLNHVGNRCLHALIGIVLKDFQDVSNRSDKSQFLEALVRSIERAGGRFLHRGKDHSGGWTRDDLQSAKDKIRSTLRHAIKKPEAFKESLSMDVTRHVCCCYCSAHDFDWKGMVARVARDQQQRSLEINDGASLSEATDANHDPQWGVGFQSDPEIARIINSFLSASDGIQETIDDDTPLLEKEGVLVSDDDDWSSLLNSEFLDER